MRVERALCALILIGLAGGCTSGEKEPAVVDPAPTAGASAPAWSEPANYSFVLSRGCDAAAPLGRYQATVTNGAVTGATRVGAPAAAPSASAEVDLGPVTGDEGEEIDVPTLGELVAMAETAQEDGAQVSTEFDRTDGHPAKVTINVTDTPGGAECWIISDYKV
ncbi:hypothetical protein [Actinoplanes utahensis]|uniref:hypothetical protein n=1 Tax=Actinoplanes utahensis TaxID=1869 RepID=UPI000A50D193|nr:hypothetical protein [Actinoplanes utahensis]GIF34177.1 hypothetical protein Aut01nite_71630 [Actinoplanes utahensis]